ncbi:winged helix-turn-helix domain-containing protein [Streptosporangiaceae bacterium NEAU-GS5]|nr:winged helix-turn-helix domain-containing protein [Streptosporangiaceae bacterium NEAU-GS5]
MTTSFAVLGSLEVRDDGTPVEIGGQRLRALLTLLLLDAGRTVPTDRLVAGVWEDRPPSGVGNALQALVSRLRGTIDRELVVGGPAGYRLVVSPDQVDLHRFTRLATEGRKALAGGDAVAAARALAEALGLWRGEPLADLPDREAEVARLEGLRLGALEDRIEADLLLGRAPEVVSEVSALVAAHPLSERLRLLLMRALYGSGRQVEALAAYEDAKEAFAEFGADPSPQLAELHLKVLRRDVEESPDATEPLSGKGNLKARLTSFVGREDDVQQALRLLRDHRLVTLVGPGGAGKTRLAVEAADRARANGDSDRDGAWLVELAPLTDPAEVAQAVLTAVGPREAPLLSARGRLGAGPELGPEDRLITLLNRRELLIVLDNCEHVVAAAAALADRLLAECPRVRILATSREPLGITGEMLWPITSLGLDAAVRLFAERAAAARPGERVAPEVAERICRDLDGLPLAIELAAARLRTMPAAQIADRLAGPERKDERFRLLTGGSRTAQPRHQTLRAVVEWSWELLDPEERELAMRLSVYLGGATLETLGGEDFPDAFDVLDVLDVLSRLVDKSFVVFDGARYTMLETIRAYAAERLAESGQDHAVRLGHALRFAALAEQGDPELRGHDQIEWVGRLTAEHDNMSVALRFAIGAGEIGLALRLVGALGWYWWLVGNRIEGGTRAAEVLALVRPGAGIEGAFEGVLEGGAGAGSGAESGADAERVALVAAIYGIMVLGGGAHDQAKRVLDRVDELSARLSGRSHPIIVLAGLVRALFLGRDEFAEGLASSLIASDDAWVAAAAHLFRAHIFYNRGEVDAGEADAREALQSFREVGDRWGVGNALATLAEAGTLRGRHTAAVGVMREAIALMDEVGALEETPYLRTRLALALNADGDRAGAYAALDMADEVAARAHDLVGEAGVHNIRGDFAREDGDFELARHHYHEAVRRLEDPGDVWPATAGIAPPQLRATLNCSLGYLAEQEGDAVRARRLHAAAIRLAVESRDGPILGHTLIGQAGLRLLEGAPEEAALLLGASAAIRGFDEVSGYDHERVTDATTAALGPGEFARCRERGRQMPREEILSMIEI